MLLVRARFLSAACCSSMQRSAAAAHTLLAEADGLAAGIVQFASVAAVTRPVGSYKHQQLTPTQRLQMYSSQPEFDTKLPALLRAWALHPSPHPCTDPSYDRRDIR
jgi:hypothetical protein